MVVIDEYRDLDLSRTRVQSVLSLLNETWPKQQSTIDAFVKKAQEHQHGHRSAGSTAPIRFIVWEGRRAIAHANTYARTILTAEGPLGVMALSGVCVASAHRGRNLGVAITKRAFARVDKGDFSVSLFQTLVPGFYEKLGARTVTNPFVNSRNTKDPTANPWQDAYVMIYPASYPWPGGLIDLNGPSY